MITKTQSFVIDGLSVTRALDGWSDQRFSDAVDQGRVQLLDGYPVPVVVLNRLFDRVQHPAPMCPYSAARIAVDGQWLGHDTPYLVIDVADTSLVNGEVARWECAVSYVDVMRHGRGQSRVLARFPNNSPATPQAVQQQLETACAMLPSFDYTSEWLLEDQRAHDFHALLGDFPQLPSRQEYEMACRAHSITPAVDGSMNYAAKYYDAGVGGFAKLDPFEQLATTLHLRRARAFLVEQTNDPRLVPLPATSPRLAPSRSCPCGATGSPGHYPFSTAPLSGRCDDCL